MIKVKDKSGQEIYVKYTRDSGDNFHCKTYSDEPGFNKIDDFVVKPTDIYDYYLLDYPRQIQALEQYIRDYYSKTELDLL